MVPEKQLFFCIAVAMCASDKSESWVWKLRITFPHSLSVHAASTFEHKAQHDCFGDFLQIVLSFCRM